MGAFQTSYGRAFEYSCIKSLEKVIGPHRPVSIINNISLSTAKAHWDDTPGDVKAKMDQAAEAGTKTLLKLEPRVTTDGKDNLELSLQTDQSGNLGDVRDVLIIRRAINWEVGVSVKHNHTAVKHSRLSQTIDFGQEWVGIPCSDNYFKQIDPIFSALQEARTARKRWSEINDKSGIVYKPLLDAFKKELETIDGNNPGVAPPKLLEYLLGRKDFYKLISDDRKKTTLIQAINIKGTLNKPSDSSAPVLRAGTVRLPTKIHDFNFKPTPQGPSQTTLILTMDGGWTLTFRIHNARTLVEPSLKFDIQLSGVPASLFAHHEPWR